MQRLVTLLLLAILPGPVSAQSGPRQKPDPDQLGMTCAQILQMTSSDWIARIAAMDDSVEDGQLRGIRVYGQCYDERTDRLAVSLARSGKGPLMGARGDFRDFDAALKDFTAMALAATTTEWPTAPLKSAYAALYEKQFRYAFYQGFESKSPKAARDAKPRAPAASAGTAPAASSPNTSSAKAPNEVDEMTNAKNRFGELLGALPEDKLHELHAAFGKILGLHAASPATQLAVYRYAIFLLEPQRPPANPPRRPTSSTPFSPPPF